MWNRLKNVKYCAGVNWQKSIRWKNVAKSAKTWWEKISLKVEIRGMSMRRPLLAQLNPVWLDSFIIEIIIFFRVPSSQLIIFGCRMQVPNQRRKASGITRSSSRGKRKRNWYVITIVINNYFLNNYAFPPQNISRIISNLAGPTLWLNFHQPSDSSTTFEILQSLFTAQFWCQ